jgi:hypothetical protein
MRKDNYMFHEWGVFKEPCEHCMFRHTLPNSAFCSECIHTCKHEFRNQKGDYFICCDCGDKKDSKWYLNQVKAQVSASCAQEPPQEIKEAGFTSTNSESTPCKHINVFNNDMDCVECSDCGMVLTI